MQLLEFTPLYMERVWGGRNLQSKLGRKLPQEGPIGESWEIVDREDEQSIVAAGPYAGLTLRELLNRYSDDILGPGHDSSKPFPILVKWLDCQQRLSLQVHPPAKIAPLLKGEPKTENWYIANADEGASLIVGLKKGTTRELLEKAIGDGEVETYANRFSVKSGDSILVESGCVHAIEAGNLILEIQQNSDTTYRIYDWGRLGLDGLPRKLHIDESLKSIDFDHFEPTPIANKPGAQILADCKEFRIRKFDLTADTTVSLSANEQACLIHIISGTVMDKRSRQSLLAGNNYLKPYIAAAELASDPTATVLITDNF